METIEGIIIKVTPFAETAHILTLFSKQHGTVSLIYKNGSKKQLRSYSPLLKIEALTVVSEKELWKAKELTILCSYQGLRLSLEKLTLAIYLLQAVAKIVPEKTSCASIYTLFDEHLLALHSTVNPYAVAASFLLKLYLEE